jgi:hypothetical protein
MAESARPVFVLHEHRKPQPHYDLRLEEGGVLRSWAVPKGMPPDTRTDRLAGRRRSRPGPRDVHRRAQGHRRHRLVGARGPHREALCSCSTAAPAPGVTLINTGTDWLLHLTKSQPRGH